MKGTNYKWIAIVTILAFIISVIMTIITTFALKNVSLLFAIIITLIFIIIGISFDIIGVAATSADEVIFHSISARKLKVGRIGVKLVKNASKVSSICCDVIGDVCGIVSGSLGVTIIALINNNSEVNSIVTTLIVTGLISSLTIGGKALGKGLAINKSKKVIILVAKILAIF